MVKRNKALRSPDCFLGADIGAAAAVGATVAFFCIDYIGHSSVGSNIIYKT
jgi:hypothetical protein